MFFIWLENVKKYLILKIDNFTIEGFKNSIFCDYILIIIQHGTHTGTIYIKNIGTVNRLKYI